MLTQSELGSWGESYAARLYERVGFKVLVRNSFNPYGKRLGEIDLVVSRPGILIFVEVKTRVSTKFGLPEESITRLKRARLIKSADWFMSSHQEFQKFQYRIDVCAILVASAVQYLPVGNLDKYVKYSKIITNAVELN